MPSSLQARMMRSAISPRLAMRTLLNTLLNADQRLAKLYGGAIFHQDFSNDAFDLGFYLIHDLHGFDDAYQRLFVDFLSNFGVRRRIGRRRPIKRSDHRRENLLKRCRWTSWRCRTF